MLLLTFLIKVCVAIWGSFKFLLYLIYTDNYFAEVLFMLSLALYYLLGYKAPGVIFVIHKPGEFEKVLAEFVGEDLAPFVMVICYVIFVYLILKFIALLHLIFSPTADYKPDSIMKMAKILNETKPK